MSYLSKLFILSMCVGVGSIMATEESPGSSTECAFSPVELFWLQYQETVSSCSRPKQETHAIMLDLYCNAMRSSDDEATLIELAALFSDYLLTLEQNHCLREESTEKEYMEKCLTALFETYHRGGILSLSSVQSAIDKTLKNFALEFNGYSALFILECLHGRLLDNILTKEQLESTLALLAELGVTFDSTIEASEHPLNNIPELAAHISEKIEHKESQILKLLTRDAETCSSYAGLTISTLSISISPQSTSPGRGTPHGAPPALSPPMAGSGALSSAAVRPPAETAKLRRVSAILRAAATPAGAGHGAARPQP